MSSGLSPDLRRARDALLRALEQGEGPGRQMLAEALFDRLDVLGFREMVAHPTAHAVARGLVAALPQRMDITVGHGRGERGSASLAHLRFRPRFVLENVTGPRVVWPVIERKAG